MSNKDKSIPIFIQSIMGAPRMDETFALFCFFSRFEYALKRTSKYIAGNEKEAKANWTEFANTNNGKFSKLIESEKVDAIAYFLKNPPKKQIFKDGKLEWSEPNQLTESDILLDWILICVRRVRNNLFHGGKFPMHPIEEPSRNKTLINHSVSILSLCAPLDDNVYRYLVEKL